jgi:6-phosphogluconolactonase
METIQGREIEIIVADDAEEVARIVGGRLADAARAGQSIVLTGGSGPIRSYQLAAELEPDWSKSEVWFGDDRCVPPDDERSNYKQAKEQLLDRLQGAPKEIHRIKGELGKDAGADDYEQQLGGSGLGLVLLGMGPDGHIASLYPNQPTLDVSDRRVVGAEAHLEPFVDRVSMTLPTLRGGDSVLFIIMGEDKAEKAAAAFKGDPDHSTPASLMRADSGNTVAVLDRAASSRL